MTDHAARQLSRMFRDIASAMADARDWLTELDGAIGDADHGITMALGFEAVTAALAREDLDRMAPSALFEIAATAFLDAVGASTGPLYATAFRRAARFLRTQEPAASNTPAQAPSLAARPLAPLSTATQAGLLQAMAAGIAERGKGQRGDKTMLDAWIPAAEAAESAAGLDAASLWRAVLPAAEAGAEATRSMTAARGRAARLGERSLGHIDPGAASAVILLQAMARVLADQTDAS
ncbi:dihydroxyacetone kinase subunit L [Rhizobium rhizosphaerae]|uniref:Dihydroxyacetone kinase subunit L n=1 Tax=Xaviernesmea rhizosphaerae TaxID=1672749 RepID=A0A1Q9AD23_9HYPH|nr:dihydroxyacetone kinase subunit DhaL [Xaviernesmea rhizosphaerae]OLP52822.1 dihydroxyacetone kinase subunit L [Xaviernesmea rhizosphaerae]